MEMHRQEDGEIQLTDALQKLIASDSLYAFQFAGEHYDTGTFNGWLETTVKMALNNPDIAPRLKQYITKLPS